MMDAFELPRTLVQSLQRRAAQTPDQVALRFLAESADDTVVLSYRDLDLRARTIAAALQASAGLGERAVLLFPSGPDYVAAFLAACTPGSSRYRPIRRSRPVAITRSGCCRSLPMPSQGCC